MKTLFIDATNEWEHPHVQTGIQRVTRSLITEALRLDADHRSPFRIRPVVLGRDRAFHTLVRVPVPGDAPCQQALFGESFAPEEGDCYFIPGSPWDTGILRELEPYWRNGLALAVVFHDLIPLEMPWVADSPMEGVFAGWLRDTATYADYFACDSLATRDSLHREMLIRHPSRELSREETCTYHLGSITEMREVESMRPSNLASPTRSFLMVGTLEPRKNHMVALSAFTYLWSRGVDVSLTIVGKQGWNVDSLARQIELHPEYGKRLLWRRDITDKELHGLYANSDCLIASSYLEGFDLPVVEALSSGMQIIASDIDVHREVSGHFARYFPPTSVAQLADAVMAVVAEPRVEKVPLPWLTWEEVTVALLDRLSKHVHPNQSLRQALPETVMSPRTAGIESASPVVRPSLVRSVAVRVRPVAVQVRGKLRNQTPKSLLRWSLRWGKSLVLLSRTRRLALEAGHRLARLEGIVGELGDDWFLYAHRYDNLDSLARVVTELKSTVTELLRGSGGSISPLLRSPRRFESAIPPGGGVTTLLRGTVQTAFIWRDGVDVIDPESAISKFRANESEGSVIDRVMLDATSPITSGMAYLSSRDAAQSVVVSITSLESIGASTSGGEVTPFLVSSVVGDDTVGVRWDPIAGGGDIPNGDAETVYLLDGTLDTLDHDQASALLASISLGLDQTSRVVVALQDPSSQVAGPQSDAVERLFKLLELTSLEPESVAYVFAGGAPKGADVSLDAPRYLVVEARTVLP